MKKGTSCNKGKDNYFYGKHLCGAAHSMYGKCHSEETLRKMSRVKSGAQNAMYGNHHSEEVRRKISETKKSQHLHLSELHREKIRRVRLQMVFPRRDTSIEVKMQRFLSGAGVPFETHKPIIGQPDIFVEPNICIFCDGDYWHHYPDGKERDREVNMELRGQGYTVIRIWEHDINAVLAYE